MRAILPGISRRDNLVAICLVAATIVTVVGLVGVFGSAAPSSTPEPNAPANANEGILGVTRLAPGAAVHRTLHDVKITRMKDGSGSITWSDSAPQDQGVVAYTLKADLRSRTYQTWDAAAAGDDEDPIPTQSEGCRGYHFAYAQNTAYYDKNDSGDIDPGEKLAYAYQQFSWNWESNRFPRTRICGPSQTSWKRKDWRVLGWIAYAEITDNDDGVNGVANLKVSEEDWHDLNKLTNIKVGTTIRWDVGQINNHMGPTVDFYTYQAVWGADTAVSWVRFHHRSGYSLTNP